MVYRRKPTLSYSRTRRIIQEDTRFGTMSKKHKGHPDKIGNPTMASVRYPTAAELIALNKAVLTEIKVKKANRHQVISRESLRHILERVRSEGEDIYDKALILLTELVRRHPFASGVRRTGIAAAVAFLNINGENVKVTHDPNVLQGIREGFYTAEEIKSWLKGHGIRKFKRE